jgi:hypothetical protein
VLRAFGTPCDKPAPYHDTGESTFLLGFRRRPRSRELKAKSPGLKIANYKTVFRYRSARPKIEDFIPYF